MTDYGDTKWRDEVLLLSRVLFMLLYLLAGWDKISDISGTMAYFTKIGVPFPAISTIIAIVIEVPIGIAIVLGFQTRRLALLLAVYTVGTAILGHPYWTASGAARLNLEHHFFKNISITGGFLLMYLTGAGKYSLDAMRRAKK
jgi:putative oxidoreductase